MLSSARTEPDAARLPKALIVPHAGYVYSGPVAASAYRILSPLRGRIERVVLFGPAHRVYVRGMALPTAPAFSTPLGNVAVDSEAVDIACKLPEVARSAEAHDLEHSLEVQLPFLQQVLGSFKLVPFAVGSAHAERVADVIEALDTGPGTLIVISSDLSHYHPYGTAREIDHATAEQILGMSSWIDHEQACGATPVNGLLLWARKHGLAIELLDLRNSGDTAGDKLRVVGYGSFALYEPASHVQ